MKKYYCKNCRKEICYNSVYYGSGLCRSCSCKERYKIPENNPNYKHGNNITNKKCLDCKNIIYPQATRCDLCEDKHHAILMTGKTNPFQAKRMIGKNNPNFGKITHGKGSYYNNIWMRSTWEIALAKWFDKQNIKWLYESKTFDLGNCTYTPDFYLPETDTYVEVKGFWRDDAKKKFEEFKKIYCGEKIKVLGKQELKNLNIIKRR
jgi:hypothetical protein